MPLTPPLPLPLPPLLLSPLHLPPPQLLTAPPAGRLTAPFALIVAHGGILAFNRPQKTPLGRQLPAPWATQRGVG